MGVGMGPNMANGPMGAGMCPGGMGPMSGGMGPGMGMGMGMGGYGGMGPAPGMAMNNMGMGGMGMGGMGMGDPSMCGVGMGNMGMAGVGMGQGMNQTPRMPGNMGVMPNNNVANWNCGPSGAAPNWGNPNDGFGATYQQGYSGGPMRAGPVSGPPVRNAPYNASKIIN